MCSPTRGWTTPGPSGISWKWERPRALRRLGSDKLRTLAALLQEYDRALQESLEHREGNQP